MSLRLEITQIDAIDEGRDAQALDEVLLLVAAL